MAEYTVQCYMGPWKRTAAKNILACLLCSEGYMRRVLCAVIIVNKINIPRKLGAMSVCGYRKWGGYVPALYLSLRIL